MMVCGIAYDSHRLVEGEDFVLGGEKINYKKGFCAHSDGDLLTHAIIDALLGASGFSDIGEFFPDTEAKYKNIRSLVLLEEVNKKLLENNCKIIYIDCVIIAEEPKISPYKEKMKENVCKTLGIEKKRINIKSKTNEQMDAVGRKEGVSCFVVVTVDREL